MSDVLGTLQAWWQGGQLVEFIIALTVLEAVALLAYHRLTGKGLSPGHYALNLTSGLCLMLAVRAAELYYEENKTQDEIGAILRITRWKVGRLLHAARAEGIVRIEIAHPKAEALQSALAPLFHDPRVVILQGPAKAMRATFTTPHGARVLE